MLHNIKQLLRKKNLSLSCRTLNVNYMPQIILDYKQIGDSEAD